MNEEPIVLGYKGSIHYEAPVIMCPYLPDVVREYNGPTSRKTLWKVLSRRMKDKFSAEEWMDFEKKTEKCKHGQEFFIVTKMEEADDEYWKWYEHKETKLV